MAIRSSKTAVKLDTKFSSRTLRDRSAHGHRGVRAIAGSTKIGKGCRIGGAAMMAGTCRSPTDGPSAGHCRDYSLTERAITPFFPLMTQREWERAAAVVRKLPELRSRVRQLESERKAAESKTEK